MKIVFGVCSLGQGHINRQKLIIKNFLNKGHQILVVTSSGNNYFQQEFLDVSVVSCSVPWISTDNDGIDFIDCLKKHENNNIDYFKEFLLMSIEIEKYFNGEPDLVISDYEPNVAKYAYARDIKLVNLEQQSKFLYLSEQNVNNINLLEEKSRIKYFFPKSDFRIISSFFDINYNGDESVFLIPPIIAKNSTEFDVDDKLVVVYFSTYGSVNYKLLYIKILDMIKDNYDFVFKVYTDIEFPSYKDCSNIMFCKFSQEFKLDLEKCKFVISTSGHQLTSECIAFNKPLLLTSFNTFEQNYNLKMVEKFGLGKRIEKFTIEEFNDFVSHIDLYLDNIIDYKNKYMKYDWESSFNKCIDKILEG